MILLGFLLMIANILFAGTRYLLAFINVEQHAVSTNLGYILVFSTLPFVWWAYSTKEDHWNWYNTKKRNLKLAVICAVLTLMSPIWTLVFDTLVIRACRLPVGRNLDSTMIMNLCRIFLVLIPGAIGYSIVSSLFAYFGKVDTVEKIETLKWQKIFDTRKNKEWKYDLNIIKEINTGTVKPIKEDDRRVHMLIPGQSGTGKTSSILIPAMACDLNNKQRNMEKRHKEMLRMILTKKARITRPEKGRGIDEWCVKANPGYEEELSELKKTYGDCGMTIMAPDNDMHKDVIKLAKARHFKVNSIDPMALYKDANVVNCSINPFYIPKGLANDKRLEMIIEKAQTFASVIVAVNDLSGGGEQYFKDINTAVTTNIATLCMLHANLNDTQTCMSEIQTCINEMSKLQEVVDEIEEHLHIKVKVFDFAKKKDQKGGITSAEDVKEMERGADNGKYEFYPIETEDELPQWAVDQKLTVAACNEVLLQEAESYYNALHSVLSELLGSSAEEMFNQTRGLRTIIDKLMMDPRFKRVLDGKDENLLDFEEALLRNEITIINTGIKVNADKSTALGLFILYMIKVATVRRPEDTRTCHFLYVDEASQYLNPVYEDMFALYRKYNVSCILALQTLSQLDKNPSTRYLKGVLTGAGIQIVYGRATPEDQKFYESIGGMKYVEEKQSAVTENSEFDSRYNITRSTRSSLKQESTTMAHTIRKRNFQEVTVYMVNEGNVEDGFRAKTSFLNKKEFEEKETDYVSFEDYATFDLNNPEKDIHISMPEITASQVVDAKTLQTKAMVRRKAEVLRMDALKNIDEDEMLEEIEEQKNLLREKYGLTDNSKKEDEAPKDESPVPNKDDAMYEILKRYGYGQKVSEPKNEETKTEDTKEAEPKKPSKETPPEPVKTREETLSDDNFGDIFADMGIASIEAPKKPIPKKRNTKAESQKNAPSKNGKKKATKEFKGQTSIVDDDAMALIKDSFGGKKAI